MEEIKVIIEVETEIVQSDKFAIEDAITDALKEIGIEVISVKVVW